PKKEDAAKTCLAMMRRRLGAKRREVGEDAGVVKRTVFPSQSCLRECEGSRICLEKCSLYETFQSEIKREIVEEDA
ncbi:hypothetical protein PENTCL1PPCAC_9705, partial [Pristionchus entomophagus]